MVYWGCGTPKNRCIWALFTLSAVAGSVLIIAGAARLDICSKLPVYVHISGACDAAPRAVTVIGVFVLLATIPCLLFFSGCARGPSQTKYPTEGVPSSAVTVVRQSANGPQIYQYDSHGRLIAAPDCTKHTKHTKHSQQYVLPTSPVKAAATLSPQAPHGISSSKKASSKPGGDNSYASSPQQPVSVRAYGSESGDTATAEVHVSVVGPLAAGRAAQLQQQLAQLAAQSQVEERQQQELQHRQVQDQQQEEMHR